MKIKIKDRYTSEVIKEIEVKEANLCGADLRGANLRGANLYEADLRGAKIKTTQKEELLKSLSIIVEK